MLIIWGLLIIDVVVGLAMVGCGWLVGVLGEKALGIVGVDAHFIGMKIRYLYDGNHLYREFLCERWVLGTIEE